MADLSDIAAAFSVAASAVAGVASSLDHEPERLSKTPSVTMLFQRAELDLETTGSEDWAWTWRVSLYVPLRDYKAAQLHLYTLVPRLLAITRDDPYVCGAGTYARLSDEGSEPLFNHTEGWVVKRLSLRVVTEEA